jgi:hypothetical protein
MATTATSASMRGVCTGDCLPLFAAGFGARLPDIWVPTAVQDYRDRGLVWPLFELSLARSRVEQVDYTQLLTGVQDEHDGGIVGEDDWRRLVFMLTPWCSR